MTATRSPGFFNRLRRALLAPLLVGALLALTIPAPSLAAPPGEAAQDRAEVDARLAALEEGVEPARQQAAMASLVKLGRPAIPRLLEVLGDAERSWEVRAGVAWVLGELGDAAAVEGLERAWGFKEAPETFRMQVAIALGSLGRTGPLRGMLAASPGANPILVAKASMALANLRDKEAVALIKPWLANEDIAPFIALALGRLGDDAGLALIKPLMADPMFRDYAAVALGALGQKDALLPLRYALANPDPFVRRDAIAGLARLGDTGAMGEVEALLKDPDPRVREAATEGLKRLERAKRRQR